LKKVELHQEAQDFAQTVPWQRESARWDHPNAMEDHLAAWSVDVTMSKSCLPVPTWAWVKIGYTWIMDDNGYTPKKMLAEICEICEYVGLSENSVPLFTQWFC
jgi:hypothetical protein